MQESRASTTSILGLRAIAFIWIAMSLVSLTGDVASQLQHARLDMMFGKERALLATGVVSSLLLCGGFTGVGFLATLLPPKRTESAGERPSSVGAALLLALAALYRFWLLASPFLFARGELLPKNRHLFHTAGVMGLVVLVHLAWGALVLLMGRCTRAVGAQHAALQEVGVLLMIAIDLVVGMVNPEWTLPWRGAQWGLSIAADLAFVRYVWRMAKSWSAPHSAANAVGAIAIAPTS